MLLGRYLGECAGISGTCLGVVSANLCLSCHGDDRWPFGDVLVLSGLGLGLGIFRSCFGVAWVMSGSL